jgi:hypothetical protein
MTRSDGRVQHRYGESRLHSCDRARMAMRDMGLQLAVGEARLEREVRAWRGVIGSPKGHANDT